MVTLLLDSTQLEVVLSGAERAMAFRKGNVAIERSTIAKVQLTDDAWTWLRGVPSPGTHLRGIVAMGTSPEEFKTFVGEEIARWKQVITAADIKAE